MLGQPHRLHPSIVIPVMVSLSMWPHCYPDKAEECVCLLRSCPVSLAQVLLCLSSFPYLASFLVYLPPNGSYRLIC